MYKVIYEREARKGLAGMPKKDRETLIEKINALKPDPFKATGVKKLQRRPGYRIRHRDWRAIYTVNNKKVTILVIDIDKRDKVYK
jgi:mRNA-degrading endonuclease RelE of RelBE toxin-antitoxin system